MDRYERLRRMFITPLETGEITPLLRARLEPYLNQPQAPLILNIPSQEYPILRHNWRRVLHFGWRITPRRVVAFGADRLVVLTEIAGDQFSETVIPCPALLALRVTTVLLYGQLDLVWAGRDGAENLTVEFNVAGRNLLYQGLDTVRQAAAPPVAAPDSPPAARTLADLPLKFATIALQSACREVLLAASIDHIRAAKLAASADRAQPRDRGHGPARPDDRGWRAHARRLRDDRVLHPAPARAADQHCAG